MIPTLHWLLRDLEMAPGPAHVAVEMFYPAMWVDLASNPSTSSILGQTIDLRTMRTYEAGLVARHGGAAVLDRILASREARREVLEAIALWWDLSAADQMRLVNRSVSPSLAGHWLVNSDLGTAAKASLALRAPERAVAGWLLSHQGSDDEVYEALVAHSVHGAGMRPANPGRAETLEMVLACRPGLVDRAATSGVGALVEAASVVGIRGAEAQRAAVEHLRQGADARFFIAGMLSRPELARALRADLCEWMGGHGGCADAFRGAEIEETSPGMRAYADANRTRTALLAWSCERTPVGHEVRIGSACALAELLSNPVVDRAMGKALEDELKIMMGAKSVQSQQRWLAMTPRLAASRLEITARARSGCGVPLSVEWSWRGREVGEVVAPGAATRRRGWWVRTEQEGWGADPASWTSTDVPGLPRGAGQYVGGELGDGSSADSQNRWRVFFALAEAHGGDTLEALCSTARILMDEP